MPADAAASIVRTPASGHGSSQDDTTGHGHDIEQDPAFRNEVDNGFPLAFDQGFA